MRKIPLILVLLSLSAISIAQVQQAWVAKNQYNANSFDYGSIVTTDAAGNIYVSGCTERGATIDESQDGMMTIKYDKNGVKQWAVRFKGHNMKGAGIAVDGAGNVYVVGRQDWDTAPEVFRFDFMLVKYDKDGDFVWSRVYQYSGSATYNAYMGKDYAGNLYISGTSWNAGPDEDERSKDFATLKYNTSGTEQYEVRYNGAAPAHYDDVVTGLVVDLAGNAYITGTSQKDGRVSVTTIKYATDGTELWVKRYNKTETSDDVAAAIDVDIAGNVYVVSSFGIGLLRSVAINKYGPDGTPLWTRDYHNPLGRLNTPGDIGVDPFGNVYVTGFVNPALHGNDSSDLFTVKYNTSGDQQWTRDYTLNYNSIFAQPDDDQEGDHFANMYIGADHNVYIATTLGATEEEGLNTLTLRYNPDGSLKWAIPYHSGGGNIYEIARDITVDEAGNVFVVGQAGRFQDGQSLLIKYTQCDVICPPSIVVNNDAGQCGAIVTFADVTLSGDCGATLTYTHASGAFFPVGVTTVTVTADETGATCSFTITVNDNQLPVLTCPANKSVNMNTGVCFATVDPGLATATDNCSATVTGVRSDGKLLTDNYPGGITTITWTANDGTNSVSCEQTITVIDNEPPVITGESASIVLLSPSNHTMRDVTINYDTPTDNCSVTWRIEVTSNEPVNGTGDGDTDPDWIVLDDHHVKLRAERSANGTGRIYTITITATDAAGNTAVKIVEVKVPHNIKKPHSGQAFKIGSTVALEGEFWDKPGKTHTAKWLIDGSTIVKGIVSEPNGNSNGKATGSYKFTAPGVYKLQMNVTDQDGVTHYANTAGDLEAIVVIYDPNGGYTYGGGYYNSPAGALKSNPSETGKASYGFAMNYFKNSTNPKGETQFEFKVGGFEFNALNFEYLVISNSMAQFKGTGKIIGGQSGVGFTMTVVDGQLDGTGIDKIRMKIYNKNNGQLIYDNQPGASDAALPTQAVGANSVIVIGGGVKQSSLTNELPIVRIETNELTERFEVGAFPNPHNGRFTLKVQSSKAGKMTIEYFTITGARIYNLEQQVKANEQIIIPNTGFKFNGTIFYKVSIGGVIKTGKVIGIK